MSLKTCTKMYLRVWESHLMLWYLCWHNALVVGLSNPVEFIQKLRKHSPLQRIMYLSFSEKTWWPEPHLQSAFFDESSKAIGRTRLTKTTTKSKHNHKYSRSQRALLWYCYGIVTQVQIISQQTAQVQENKTNGESVERDLFFRPIIRSLIEHNYQTTTIIDHNFHERPQILTGHFYVTSRIKNPSRAEFLWHLSINFEQ